MAEMESFVAKLPPGFGFEWTGQSLEEKTSGSQAPALYALSLIAVFLVLAALYESTSIPLSVMLVVPLGILGALLGVTLRGMPERRVLQGRDDCGGRFVSEKRDSDYRVCQRLAGTRHGLD